MLSFSRCLIFRRLVGDLLYFCPPMKYVTKCPLSSIKFEIEFGVILLNHTLASPLSVVGNALHIILSRTPCKCMRVLNDFRWSSGSFLPSYVSTYGIQNLAGRGQEVTCVVKGKSIRWTSSSRLEDTPPLMAFIIMSILSFIICMSCTMRIVPFSESDEWSMSSYLLHLLAMLLSSRSSLSCQSLFGRWLSSCSSLFRSSCWPSRQAHRSFIWFTYCSSS